MTAWHHGTVTSWVSRHNDTAMGRLTKFHYFWAKSSVDCSILNHIFIILWPIWWEMFYYCLELKANSLLWWVHAIIAIYSCNRHWSQNECLLTQLTHLRPVVALDVLFKLHQLRCLYCGQVLSTRSIFCLYSFISSVPFLGSSQIKFLLGPKGVVQP